MTAVSACQLTKTFRVAPKQLGISGSSKAFFRPQYTTVTALRSVSFTVGEGEIVGLLGPNGAGKTTLMKMLAGLVHPSEGEVVVLGAIPVQRTRAFRQQIALVMGQKSQLWWDIPANDSFLLLQKYYEIPKADFRERLEALTTLLGTTHLLATHVRKLSLGERMKMELIACLLHRPRILFLDEPTIGLDLVAQKGIRDFLLQYHELYRPTIILTSHYMADVAALCSRILLIIGGEKRFDGSLAHFNGILGNFKRVTLWFSEAMDGNPPLWQEFSADWSIDRTSVALQIPQEDLRSVVTQILLEHPVIDIATEGLPIEHVMSELLATPSLLKGSLNQENGNAVSM